VKQFYNVEKWNEVEILSYNCSIEKICPVSLSFGEGTREKLL